MSEKILILPGDGIGPSVMESVETIFDITTDSLEVVKGEIGLSAYEATGQTIPHETLDLLDECKAFICGPTVPAESGTDPVRSLKTQLGLFAKARWFVNLAPDIGVQDMDTILWYSNYDLGTEITEVPDMDGITMSKYVRSDIYHRMMTEAVTFAELGKIEKVSCVVMKDFFPQGSGMFVETFDSLFPSDIYDTRVMNVGEWATSAIKDPYRDQCIVCSDLCGDTVSGILSGLSGADHLYPTCYVGEEYGMYMPCKEANPAGVEEGYANPTSAILCASVILKEYGLRDESDAIFKALHETYLAGERTPDIGGTLSTAEFTEKVADRI